MTARPCAEDAGEAHALPSPNESPSKPVAAGRARAAGPPRPGRRTSDGAAGLAASTNEGAEAAAEGDATDVDVDVDAGPGGEAGDGPAGAELAAGVEGDAPASAERRTAAGPGEGDAAPRESGEVPAPGADWTPHGSGSLLGTTVEGRYVIEELIGVGNIGLVYRARHKVIGKNVAIKVLRSDFARDHEVSERFLVEARAASVVDNPHVVDIDDFGELPDGTAYFVMEYLDGRPLSELIRDEAPLPLERIVHVGKQIAAGLGAAHRSAIVHRDLKPDNLLLTRRGHERDFVTVVDFGIAKVAGAANRLTVAGTLYGTPHYMSPEQARGAEVDLRSDIYSLGVILYEMATGRVPFDAESPFAVVSQHVNAEPVPPHLARPEAGVSLALSELVVKCLAKAPADRYGSMAEVAAALDQALRWRPGALDPLPDVLTPDSVARPAVDAPAPPARRRARWPLALSFAAAALAVGVVYQQRHAPLASRPPPPPAATLAALSSSAAPPPAPAHAEAPPAGSHAAEAPVRGATEVALVIAPIDAHVFHQKVDLGTMPVSIPVPSGETVDVEIKRDGFLPKKVKLDGSKNKLVVRLVPLPAPAAAAAATSHGPDEAAKDPPPRPPAKTPAGPDPGPAGFDGAGSTWPADAAEPPALPTLPPPR